MEFMDLNNNIFFITKIDDKVRNICQTVEAWANSGRHAEILLLEDIVKHMKRPGWVSALKTLDQHEKPWR